MCTEIFTEIKRLQNISICLLICYILIVENSHNVGIIILLSHCFLYHIQTIICLVCYTINKWMCMTIVYLYTYLSINVVLIFLFEIVSSYFWLIKYNIRETVHFLNCNYQIIYFADVCCK